MKNRIAAPLVLTVALATSLAACARAPHAASPAVSAPAAAAEPTEAGQGATATATATIAATPMTNPLSSVVVNKSASCGCCNLWVEHMRRAGFQVEVRNQDNLNPIKERLGVPLGKGSCHTAEVGGYFVEGHVPAEDVKRLLAEKPDAKGLVVPGMPAGSPGMELPDGRTQPYTVELIGRDGATMAFAQHGQ